MSSYTELQRMTIRAQRHKQMNEIRKAMYDIKEGTHKKTYSRKTSGNTRKKHSKLNKRTMESLFNIIGHGENKVCA